MRTLLSAELEKTMEKIENIIKNTEALNQDQVGKIKTLFQDVLSKGEKYDASDVERWLERKTQSKSVVIRITNLSHYVQTKYEQTSRFRMISDDTCDC